MPTIELLDFRLRNASIYLSAEIPLANQGLVIHRGLNLDDGGFLGSGKSTVPDSLARLLVGKSGKKDTADDIINFSAKKNLEKSLRLKIDDRPIQINQFRKHNLYGNKVEVLDLDTGKDILPREHRKHPHTWIRDQLLQIDETSFFNLVYLTQDLNHVLLHGKDGERRKKLTVMFSLNVYDDFYSQLNTQISLVETEISQLDRLKAQIEEIESQLEKAGKLKTLKNKYVKAAQKADAMQAGFIATQNELEEQQELLASLKLRFTKEEELQTLWSKYDHLLKPKFEQKKQLTKVALKSLQESLKNLAKKKITLENQEEDLRRRSVIESQLSKLDESLEEIESLESIEEDLTSLKTTLHHLKVVELPKAEKKLELQEDLSQIEKPPTNIHKLQEENEAQISAIAELTSTIKSVNHRLEKGVCPTCGQARNLTKEQVDELQIKLASSRDALKKKKRRNFKLKSSLESYEQYLRLADQLKTIDCDSTLQEINTKITKLQKKERKLSSILELVKQKERLETLLEALPEGNLEDIKTKLPKIRNNYRELKKLVEVVIKIRRINLELKPLPRGNKNEVSKTVQQLKTDVRTLSSRYKKYSSKAAKLEIKINHIKSLLERISELTSKLKESSKLQNKLTCFKALKTAFHPQGMKQARFQHILKEATEKTIPAYSSMLWPRKKVSLEFGGENNLQFYLCRKGRKSSVKSQLLSGGEKHKAGLAFLLGMRDLKELYTDSSFNILIIDEPFGNLDPPGEESLLSILEMLKERFSSIFVISHRPEVINSSVWDQTWWSIRENNVSKLYTSTAPPKKYRRLAAKMLSTEGAL